MLTYNNKHFYILAFDKWWKVLDICLLYGTLYVDAGGSVPLEIYYQTVQKIKLQ